MFNREEYIAKNKFQKLSARRQHDILGDLAERARKDINYGNFLTRYAELHSWSSLDRYEPPYWLTNSEALHEFIIFHRQLGTLASTHRKVNHLSKPLSWLPVFDIEIVIDQIRSPYNVGSILRIIDNFGFKGLVHGTKWLKLDHPQLEKAARGTQQWIPVTYQADLVNYLREHDGPIIGLENDPVATPITEWHPIEEGIIVLGNEEYGIAKIIREICDQLVVIPLHGYKKSLNVHHALAIIAQKINA